MFLGLIIRPPRSNYGEDTGQVTPIPQLGASINNFEIKNSNGEKLKCTFTSVDAAAGPRPCVVYMHGNAGNKMEGLQHIQDLLPLGIDLCTFDFSGCGNSEGEYVTLGWKEVKDLHAVL